jgi:hypothetical protein
LEPTLAQRQVGDGKYRFFYLTVPVCLFNTSEFLLHN